MLKLKYILAIFIPSKQYEENMKFLAFFYLIPFLIVCQEVEMATNVIDYYSIDRFTNEIYFEQYYEPENGTILKRIMKTNGTNDFSVETNFQYVPIFSNLIHKYVYYEHKILGDSLRIFERNLEAELDNILYEGISEPLFYSPMDENLLVQSGIYNFAKDTIIQFQNIDWQKFLWEGVFQWNTDSTIISLVSGQESSIENSVIARLTVNTQLLDTLLVEPTIDGTKISTFAYNIEKNLLALSVPSQSYTNNTIKIYDLNNQEKELIRVIDSVRWNDSYYGVKELQWSPDCKYLAIIADPFILSSGGIHIFSINENMLYDIFQPESYYGVIDNLQWFDNKNIMYINRTTNTLNIYDLSSVVSVKDETNSNNLPDDYILEQNYPNPFNPSTKIKYSIPRSTEFYSVPQTTLKVYDLLGKEVATLVNEEQKAGNYEVNFDAKNLSSGIYFYRLQSGSFSQTKKLLLLK